MTKELSSTASISNPELAWYVIQCKGGESFRAAENLSNQYFEVFHPVIAAQRKRSGKLITVYEPLFPYYLFIHLDQIASNWRPIRSTRGVLKLLTFGDTPAPVSDMLIETIKQQPHTQEGAHSYFTPGQKIIITEGPLKNLEVIFKSSKGEERAIVLINMLQRDQEIEIGVHQLGRS